MSFKKVSNPAAGKSRHPAFNPSLFLPVLVILIVSCSVYINALPNGFVCDDNLQILENPWIQDIKHIPDIFSKSIWSFRKESLTSNYYRPLTHLIYLATYHIFGTQPWGFHLVNILFHAAVSVLVFMIAARLNDIFHLPASRRFLSAPFVAAIFFAVHPVHTEAVTYVSCLPELSFTLFYLLSFYFHIRFREGYGKGYLFSILFFFASALCKEPGITLPLVLAAYDYTVGNTRGRSYTHLKKYIPYLLAGGLYFALRFNALGGLAPLTENSKLSTYQNIINVFPLFTQYLEMLVFPLNLNAFHVFHPITSLTEPRGILSLAVAAAFVGLIYMALKRNRVAALCLLLIVIPLLPVFYIRGIQGGAVFYERYLYLPSFGFVILLALLMERVKEKSIRGNSIAAISFIVLAGLYAAGTVSRNFDWKDELSLFTDTARKSPDGDIPHYDLGYAYLRLGRIDEAISEYQTAIKLNPDSADAHYHLGKAYAYQSLFDQAISEYKTALKIDPDHAPSQKSLAIIGNMKQ